MLPAHKTYVEPFAGSAAVLFNKAAADVEVLNDIDPEIAGAYRTLKRVTRADVAALRAMDWTARPETFERVKTSAPATNAERLHRFLYLSRFSFGSFRKSFNGPMAGAVASRAAKRVERFGPRLRNVKVLEGDYEPVLRKFDGPDTLHYLDPPYVGYSATLGETELDEHRLLRAVKVLKGRFLLTYGTRGQLPKLLRREGFTVKRIQSVRTIRSSHGEDATHTLSQILASNYDLAQKCLGDLAADGWEIADHVDEEEPAAKASVSVPDDLTKSASTSEGDVEDGTEAPDAHPFTKTIPLIKGAKPEDERYVLGIVLEPEVVDGQGDIYSADEVERAAHRFMEEFQGLGLMHKFRVNGDVKILESYVAPADFAVGDTAIKKGTWLLAVRILSDALWKDVQDGGLTGFSIGGSARRVPEPSTPAVVAA